MGGYKRGVRMRIFERGTSLYEAPYQVMYFIPRRDDISRANLVDLAILVLRYKVEQGRASPVSCILVGGSEVETTVTCSGFLEAGSYAVLPLAFNHWDLAAKKPSVMADGTATPDSKPCVVALHSSKEIQCHENVETGPGFLVDSIFLLPGKKSVVSLYCYCT